MPKTRTDIQKELKEKDMRSRAFKKSRLPMLIKEVCDETPREKQSRLLGKSYQTVLARTKDPESLTLGELAHFYLYAAGTVGTDEDSVIEYAGLFIIEHAKELALNLKKT